MLKLSFLSRVSSSTVTYDAELKYFSYSVKNNEMLTFPATVPTLSATIKLIAADQHLSSIVRGDELKVQNADGTGVELILRAVEVSVFERAGLTEISCSGPFIEKTNEVWGTLLVPAGTLSSTSTKYGLSILKPLQDTQNGQMYVSVEKKADLLLGIAWGYDEPRNLAIMPFVGGGRADGVASSGEGVAMFKDRRPGDAYTQDEEDAESSAPVYKVGAEDIIDYAISPAQPPVTHLRTVGLGELGPTPQIPAVQVLKYSGTPGSSDIHDNVRCFYVQGKTLAAMWVAQEDENGTLISQTLYWSDGVSQTWLGGTKKQIVGIFEGAYIQVDENNSTYLNVYDRETETQLAHLRASDNNMWSSQSRSLPGVTFYFDKTSDTGVTVNAQVFMLPKIADLPHDDRVAAITKIGATFDVVSVTLPALLQYEDVLFAGASRLQHSPGNMLSAMYSFVDMHPGGEQNKARIYLWNMHMMVTSSGVTYTSYNVYVDYTRAAGDVVQAVEMLDFIDCDSSGFYEDTHVIFKTQYLPSGGVDPETRCTVYSVEHGVSDTTLLVYDLCFWVLDQSSAPTGKSDVPILTVEGDTWRMFSNAIPGATVLQSGSISGWAGSSITFFSLFKGAFVAQTYKGDNVWEVYMQLGYLPFVSRKRGSQSQSTQIDNGETNIFDLNFKVGPVQQIGRFVKGMGRIRVRLAGFDKNYFAMQQFNEFNAADIAHLNAMAVGAYVEIHPDPRDPTDVLLAKVVSWTFNYDGAVHAEFVAIIVS